jgi:hypothetical protein
LITLDDCDAFCEGDPALVESLASEQHMAMVMAFACAHGYSAGASEWPPAADAPIHRHAA